jgi:hypothetical protein
MMELTREQIATIMFAVPLKVFISPALLPCQRSTFMTTNRSVLLLTYNASTPNFALYILILTFYTTAPYCFQVHFSFGTDLKNNK